MTVRILYFAALRESLGQTEENVDLAGKSLTLGELRQDLAARSDTWAILGTMKNLKAAVNQTMAGPDTVLKDGDEVAFFPPVTGG